jgi:hypothetical protein
VNIITLQIEIKTIKINKNKPAQNSKIKNSNKKSKQKNQNEKNKKPIQTSIIKFFSQFETWFPFL